jgi:hypothetical protein
MFMICSNYAQSCRLSRTRLIASLSHADCILLFT